MGAIDDLIRGQSHSLDPNREYIMRVERSHCLDDLYVLLDP